VLIVDDVDFNRTLLSEMLRSEGYETLEAEDGLDALSLLVKTKVDLIISDLLMPNMDGLRLCAQIRRQKLTRDVPFIVYTGTFTSPNDEELAKEFGADYFLRKPVSMDVMLETIRSASNMGRTSSSLSLSSPSPGLEQTSEYSDMLIQKLEARNLELESQVCKQTEELRAVLDKLQRLYSLLPICGNCKANRVEPAYWSKVRAFVEDLPGPTFATRGICDECGKPVEKENV
jgi:CheY-like chemotaxis protein